MRLLQIDYFLAAAESLNFTSAANELYISQPALSKQIALLEEELGVKLFERSSRKVALTPAGMQFEKDLKEIRCQLEQSKKRVMSFAKTQKPVFRLACFDGAVINDFLPNVYAVVERMMPQAEISLFRGNFSENRKALEDDQADVLLTLDTSESIKKNCMVKVLCRRRASLIYSKYSPLAKKESLTLEDFSGEPFLILSEKLEAPLHQRGLTNLQKLGIVPKSIEHQENFVTLMTNLMMGHGFAILTENVVSESPDLLGYPLEESYGIDVIALWKKTHPMAQIFERSFYQI